MYKTFGSIEKEAAASFLLLVFLLAVFCCLEVIEFIGFGLRLVWSTDPPRQGQAL